jgi:hypothetical protein
MDEESEFGSRSAALHALSTRALPLSIKASDDERLLSKPHRLHTYVRTPIQATCTAGAFMQRDLAS